MQGGKGSGEEPNGSPEAARQGAPSTPPRRDPIPKSREQWIAAALALHEPPLNGADGLLETWTTWVEHLASVPASRRAPITTARVQYRRLRKLSPGGAARAVEWSMAHERTTLSNEVLRIAEAQATGTQDEASMDPKERALRKEMGLL